VPASHGARSDGSSHDPLTLPESGSMARPQARECRSPRHCGDIEGIEQPQLPRAAKHSYQVQGTAGRHESKLQLRAT
jgi:hypothetical protein